MGLLIVDEAAVYTDETGFYGYTDPRFWENYRRHVAGMIRRDRNRASLVMWSLGNEILFMNAQRFDKDLPKKLGELARYAKTIDPTHPYTFEADLDPDGAYDVIGLHYPHEMPWNRDYPNTTDWLGRRIEAEAGGGMLGQASGDFFWDRKEAALHRRVSVGAAGRLLVRHDLGGRSGDDQPPEVSPSRTAPRVV